MQFLVILAVFGFASASHFEHLAGSTRTTISGPSGTIVADQPRSGLPLGEIYAPSHPFAETIVAEPAVVPAPAFAEAYRTVLPAPVAPIAPVARYAPYTEVVSAPIAPIAPIAPVARYAPYTEVVSAPIAAPIAYEGVLPAPVAIEQRVALPAPVAVESVAFPAPHAYIAPEVAPIAFEKTYLTAPAPVLAAPHHFGRVISEPILESASYW